MTEVSVIIPTYNRPQKTIRAVTSVLYQTFPGYEIIVVDDGSRDETREGLRPFLSHITLLSHPHNLGVSAARNTGIRASCAPFVAFLDSDDYWLPEKLEAQMEYFRRVPEALICQTQEIWIRRGRRVNPHTRHKKPSGDIFKPSLRLCLVSPSAVVVRRSLLTQVGLFDEGLPACEDYDLWLRIACRHPIHLLERSLVVKEGGAGDQLSSAFEGMDRFRIRAIVKLMESGKLTPRQWDSAMEELSRKCRIYGKGCLRRGKKEEGEFFLRLPERISTDPWPDFGRRSD
jgi:glycosyltransferase involved in cell wall biosynthesis